MTGTGARITRRRLIGGAIGGLAAARLGTSTLGRATAAGLTDRVVDVVIVGSGGAGLSAAHGVLREDPNASVVVIEERPAYGGTSYRSGGRLWIPNNADMRAAGLDDPRDMAIRYMARLAHPDSYHPRKRRAGLHPRHYAQLEAYYDEGAPMLDYYRATGILPWEAERGTLVPGSADPLELTGVFAPDYHPELEENVPGRGRTVLPKHFDPTGTTRDSALAVPNYGSSLYGPDLIEWLHYSARARGVAFEMATRVVDLLVEPTPDGLRVDGVRAAAAAHGGTFVNEPVPYVESPITTTYRARRGVIFAAGGFSKSAAKLEQNFTGDHALSGGGCAVTSAVGDLSDFADRYGLLLENMDQAWFIENIYEQYLLDPDSTASPNYLLFQAYWLAGDSMFVVNREGRRVVNEKLDYNTRTKAHFEPGNAFLFSVFDQHTLDNFMFVAGQIIPSPSTWIGPANTLDDLANMIGERMQRYPATAALGLAPDFARNLATTDARFAAFATDGVDKDFHRGETSIELWWHAFCLTAHGYDVGAAGAGTTNCIAANTAPDGTPYPNPTMRPLVAPYYAVILSSGMQDTKGGPAIDEHARILDANGRVVEGLYGAGNCIASPAGEGYWGAGGTLGPATVFGHIAGRHAARR